MKTYKVLLISCLLVLHSCKKEPTIYTTEVCGNVYDKLTNKPLKSIEMRLNYRTSWTEGTAKTIYTDSLGYYYFTTTGKKDIYFDYFEIFAYDTSNVYLYASKIVEYGLKNNIDLFMSKAK
jgi:hypothetical protein